MESLTQGSGDTQQRGVAKVSVIIVTYNYGHFLAEAIQSVLEQTFQDWELIVVDDNSEDDTAAAVQKLQAGNPCIRLVRRRPPAGFGRAIRAGLEHVRGEAVVIYMADCSDRPQDAVAYYRKLLEGYDCVFGSRFIAGSSVENYPPVKLLVNRIVNKDALNPKKTK
jgi:dolichol-phosphate mannosyltransferase